MRATKHVVHISTNVGKSCEHCDFAIGGDKFAESVTRYVTNHGYRLLHVGTEETSAYYQDGSPWHSTVAVVGVE